MSIMKVPASILLSIVALLLVACAPSPPLEATLPPLPAGVTEYVPDDWGTITTAGDYLLSNCPWNQKAADSPYAHRIFKGEDGGPFCGWQWFWNNGDDYTVLAYPNAACGASPWGSLGGASGRTPGYPRAIGGISLHSTFDVAIQTEPVEGKDVWDLAFDIWVLDKGSAPATFGPVDIKGEIMVWLDANNFSLSGWLGDPLGTLTANGSDFDYWFYPDQADGNGPGGKHLYMAFVSRTPIHASSDFDLSPFFTYLTNKGYLSADDYLALVEFGTENIAGMGQVILKNYSVTLN